MHKRRCPSCGKELAPHVQTCELCGMTIPGSGQEPLVEPISPYDDLFSDDIVPPKPGPGMTDRSKPVLIPEGDFKEQSRDPSQKPVWTIPLPARRDVLFLVGIGVIGIILLSVLFFIPHPPADSGISNTTSIETPVSPVPTTSSPKTTLKPEDTESSHGYTRTDYFTDKTSGWGTSDNDVAMRYYSQGEYHIIQKGEDSKELALYGNDAKNFVAEVKTRLDSGPLTGQYGLIFRFSDDDYYSFGINGRGWFTVQKQIDGKVYDLIPLTETYILNKGYVTNTLGIKADGNTLTMYINGKMVRAISDTSLTHGDVGLFVSRLSEKGYVKEQAVHVSFDNFKYGELSSS